MMNKKTGVEETMQLCYAGALLQKISAYLSVRFIGWHDDLFLGNKVLVSVPKVTTIFLEKVPVYRPFLRCHGYS